MPTLIKHTREAVAVSEIYITLLAPVADVIRDRMGSGVNPSMEGRPGSPGKRGVIIPQPQLLPGCVAGLHRCRAART